MSWLKKNSGRLVMLLMIMPITEILLFGFMVMIGFGAWAAGGSGFDFKVKVLSIMVIVLYELLGGPLVWVESLYEIYTHTWVGRTIESLRWPLIIICGLATPIYWWFMAGKLSSWCRVIRRRIMGKLHTPGV